MEYLLLVSINRHVKLELVKTCILDNPGSSSTTLQHSQRMHTRDHSQAGSPFYWDNLQECWYLCHSSCRIQITSRSAPRQTTHCKASGMLSPSGLGPLDEIMLDCIMVDTILDCQSTILLNGPGYTFFSNCIHLPLVPLPSLFFSPEFLIQLNWAFTWSFGSNLFL